METWSLLQLSELFFAGLQFRPRQHFLVIARFFYPKFKRAQEHCAHADMSAPLVFLRPSLIHRVTPSRRAASAYLALYNLAAPTSRFRQIRCKSDATTAPQPPEAPTSAPVYDGPRIRVASTGALPLAELSSDPERLWPRIHKPHNPIEIKSFRQKYKDIPRDHVKTEDIVTVRGQ